MKTHRFFGKGDIGRFRSVLIWTGPNAGAIEGVSPGAADRLAQVNNTCPTFSWDGKAARS